MITIEAADGQRYARLDESAEGVTVEIWLRRARGQYDQTPDKRIYGTTLQCPMHIARDLVHDILTEARE